MTGGARPGLVDRVVGVRRRIVAAGAGLAILVSATGGFILIGQVDRIIRSSELSILESSVAEYQDEVTAGRVTAALRIGSGDFVAVSDPAGTVAIDTFPRGVSAKTGGVSLSQLTQRTINGADYFQVSLPLQGRGGTWEVTVARDASLTESIRNSLIVLLSVTLLVVAVGFAIGSWFLAATVLRQVTRLRLAAERLAAGGSSEFLPVPGAGDEIAALATTLNALISRLRQTADRERQLVSDASHELRTPLAILQAQLELARVQDTTIDDYSRDLDDAERSVRRLSHIASSLLELSRVEAASTPGTATLEELAEELCEAVDRARLRAGARSIEIDFAERVDAGALADRVSIDAIEFGRLLDNLLANSLSAMGDTGSIMVEFRGDELGAMLSVDDTAGGMPVEFVGSALDRFSRPPGGHSGDGAGLGLAIVRRLVELADGRISLDNRPGDGLTVLVELPTNATDQVR